MEEAIRKIQKKALKKANVSKGVKKDIYLDIVNRCSEWLTELEGCDNNPISGGFISNGRACMGDNEFIAPNRMGVVGSIVNAFRDFQKSEQDQESTIEGLENLLRKAMDKEDYIEVQRLQEKINKLDNEG